MGDEIRNKDDAKGRVKEAAGNLTGDNDLKREGKVDQATGKAKEGLEKADRQGQGRPAKRGLTAGSGVLAEESSSRGRRRAAAPGPSSAVT